MTFGFLRWAWLLALGACGGVDGTPHAGPRPPAAESSATCPATAPAPTPLPSVRPEHRTLDYWAHRLGERADDVLLTPEEIATQNRALQSPYENQPLSHTDLLAPIDEPSLAREIAERLAFLREHFASGEYVNANGERLSNAELAHFADVASVPMGSRELRVALAPVAIHCGPRAEGFYKPTLDLAFDRNLCSTAHAQEVVQVLGAFPSGARLARTRYTIGWIAADAPLSPALSAADAEAFVHGPRATLVRDVTLASGEALPLGTMVPIGRFASARGVEALAAPPDVVLPTNRPLTRRAVFERAFAFLGAAYGWGDRDCSSFLLDVFDTFGLQLPRHSARQAVAGTYTIEVPEGLGDRDRVQLLESASAQGVLLLQFPGHVMLYLGQNDEGAPMAIHAFAEYVEPCPGERRSDGSPAETLHTVNEVTVSNLELGRGSSRRSFLERITKIAVLGRARGPQLVGVATPRPAAPVIIPEGRACDDSLVAQIFRSPATPNTRAPMRVIATVLDDPGPLELALVSPRGARTTPALARTGGPPFGFIATVDTPEAGTWTAVLGDGPRVVACERFRVDTSAARPAPAAEGEPTWQPRLRWERDTEALFSTFVEKLFDYPVDEDLTWTNLQTLLQNRDNNILYDHLSLGEDAALRLRPDCADLPYFLRAYFSWKMRLPFAFRQCSRGRAGEPPSCGPPISNMEPRGGSGELDAFNAFIRRVASGVHSATARTSPRDDDTDAYPVPLRRETMPPGTVYADPDGHVMVVARWVPQGTDRYGVLMAADAQPDGTIGRPRFWRGTFLFTPETTNVGAGFKAWRPLRVDGGQLVAETNETLRRTRDHVPYSTEQYDGSKDDFYDRVETAINPRPLDPEASMRALVDALEEAVTRRLVSVENGVQYFAGNGSVIEMPEGYSIFETTGAWEDYSTPSRDMRLLIAVEAVQGFPDALERGPQRFGVSREEATALATRLRGRLTTDLGARSFHYTRSDGSTQTLTLADIAARTEGFEMAYNPNDCVEIRWAAPEGSPERATCRRHAPESQRARMTQYRAWFRDRRRPPRGT